MLLRTEKRRLIGEPKYRDRSRLFRSGASHCVRGCERTIKTHNVHLSVAQRLQWFCLHVKHSARNLFVILFF